MFSDEQMMITVVFRLGVDGPLLASVIRSTLRKRLKPIKQWALALIVEVDGADKGMLKMDHVRLTLREHALYSYYIFSIY
jgi:hypothetical protein